MSLINSKPYWNCMTLNSSKDIETRLPQQATHKQSKDLNAKNISVDPKCFDERCQTAEAYRLHNGGTDDDNDMMMKVMVTVMMIMSRMMMIHALRSFSEKNIITGPLCHLCEDATFVYDADFAAHKQKAHSGENEYRKGVLFLMNNPEVVPLLARRRESLFKNLRTFSNSLGLAPRAASV